MIKLKDWLHLVHYQVTGVLPNSPEIDGDGYETLYYQADTDLPKLYVKYNTKTMDVCMMYSMCMDADASKLFAYIPKGSTHEVHQNYSGTMTKTFREFSEHVSQFIHDPMTETMDIELKESELDIMHLAAHRLNMSLNDFVRMAVIDVVENGDFKQE